MFSFCVLKGGRCGQVYVPSSGSNPPGRQVVTPSLIAEREEFELLVFLFKFMYLVPPQSHCSAALSQPPSAGHPQRLSHVRQPGLDRSVASRSGGSHGGSA